MSRLKRDAEAICAPAHAYRRAHAAARTTHLRCNSTARSRTPGLGGPRCSPATPRPSSICIVSYVPYEGIWPVAFVLLSSSRARRQAVVFGALKTERTINGVIMSSGFRDEFFPSCFSLLRAHECIMEWCEESPGAASTHSASEPEGRRARHQTRGSPEDRSRRSRQHARGKPDLLDPLPFAVVAAAVDASG